MATLTRLLRDKPAALVYVEELKRIHHSRLWTWEATLIFVDESRTETRASPFASFGRHTFTGVLLRGETEEQLRKSIQDSMLTPVEVVFPSIGLLLAEMGVEDAPHAQEG